MQFPYRTHGGTTSLEEAWALASLHAALNTKSHQAEQGQTHTHLADTPDWIDSSENIGP